MNGMSKPMFTLPMVAMVIKWTVAHGQDVVARQKFVSLFYA